MTAVPREPTLVEAFVPQFEAARLDHFATGGFAAILYGEPRLTTDLDVVVALGRREVARLHAAFDPDEYDVPPPAVMLEEAQRAKHGYFNFYHHRTGLRSDVYLAGDDALEAWAMENRRRFDVDATWTADSGSRSRVCDRAQAHLPPRRRV